MAIDLVDYERKAREAVQVFWQNRERARVRQKENGTLDQGERAGVTAGNNMNGFVALIRDIVKANGLGGADIYEKGKVLTLPGFYRPTKCWDLLVIFKGELVAAVELKSQAGPSFGNNFNNRTEEAIGTAHDLWTAYREGALGKQGQPFVGWFILVEDIPKSRAPVKNTSPHFPVLEVFNNTSYVQRYDILCQKLITEKLYTAASIITSRRDNADVGEYSSVSSLTGLRTFITSFAGHIAATSARLK